MKNLTLNELSHHSGVAVDSRLVKPGNLFFALPGDQTDGHAYLPAAAEKGAISAVVLNNYSGSDHGLSLIRVPDVLEALQTLAKNYLKAVGAQVIAITGSVGKTTTKHFLAQLLAIKFKVAASPGNANSQIGLPLSILNDVKPDTEILVQEMGMDQPGHIAKLVRIAPPKVAIVTSVSLVHACNFNSIEEIACAKAEIFAHPETEIGFYHLESDFGGGLRSSGSCRKQTFSTNDPAADIYLSSAIEPLRLPGAHNKQNLLAAIAAAQYLGMTQTEINAAIKNLTLPEKRFQIIEKEGVIFINDAYNASEQSVKAALDSLPAPKEGGKKIAVLSDMRELGKFSEGCHRAVAKHALNSVDFMLCYGEESRHIFSVWQEAQRPVVWSLGRSEIVLALKSNVKPGDVVLLKGSNSMQVWKVLEEFV